MAPRLIRIVDRTATTPCSLSTDGGEPQTVFRLGHIERQVVRRYMAEIRALAKDAGPYLEKLGALVKGMGEGEKDPTAIVKTLGTLFSDALAAGDGYARLADIYRRLLAEPGAVRGIENLRGPDGALFAETPVTADTLANVLDYLTDGEALELGVALKDHNSLSDGEKKSFVTPALVISSSPPGKELPKGEDNPTLN